MRIDGSSICRRKCHETCMTAPEVSAIQLGQIVDVGAWIDERAAHDESPLEFDDAVDGLKSPRLLQDLPLFEMPEAHLQHIQIEGRVEVVAIGTLTRETVDPGDDPAIVIEMVVQRHGYARLVLPGADLVAAVEINQRLIQHRLGAAGLP